MASDLEKTAAELQRVRNTLLELERQTTGLRSKERELILRLRELIGRSTRAEGAAHGYKRRIVAALTASGRMKVSDIIASVGGNPSTARVKLCELAKHGKIRRVAQGIYEPLNGATL